MKKGWKRGRRSENKGLESMDDHSIRQEEAGTHPERMGKSMKSVREKGVGN